MNKLFDHTLALRFPPPFGQLQVYGWGGSVEDGAPLAFLYLQAGLNAGASAGLSPPFITQVDPDLEAELMKLRPNDPASRRYAGFVLSQNFINQLVNARWRAGAFNYQFTDDEITSITGLLAAAKKDGEAPRGLLHGHIWPAVSPRTVLTPNTHHPISPFFLNEPAPYAMTFFDDLRLCLGIRAEGGPGQLKIQFSGFAFTQIGFGGIDPTTKEVNLGRFSDSEFDLYFDLDHKDVQIMTPEIQNVTSFGFGFDGLGLSRLPALQSLLTFALRTALASRSDRAIPSAPGNRLQQRYKLPAASLKVDLLPRRGNLYGWISLAGPMQDDSAPDALSSNQFLINRMPPSGVFDLATLMMDHPAGIVTVNDINCAAAKIMLSKL